jgi:hypothetical protein
VLDVYCENVVFRDWKGGGQTYSHWLRCCPEGGTIASLKYTLQILTSPYLPPIVAMTTSLVQEQS